MEVDSMPARKTTRLKTKPKIRLAKSRPLTRAEHLEKAMQTIRRQYPELAGYLVLMKRPSKGHILTEFSLADDRRCKRWAWDKQSGKPVCIEYE
jgi:hypothetical protein